MKNFYLPTIFLIICLAVANSCSMGAKNENAGVNSNTSNTEAAADMAGKGAAAAADMDKSIRKIDFKNFAYEASCAGEDAVKITVKNGEFSRETQEEGYTDRFYFNIFDVGYGDVNGDNSEDAIILSVCNTGGSGQFSEGFVYTMRDGKPSLLTRIGGGDRADGGLRSAKMEYGFLVVERNDAGEGGGACCPEFYVTTKYKWDGKKLAQWGDEVRRELYPAQRVNFAKGSSKASLKVSVDEIKRYVIGARAGQTLNVSVSSSDVTLSLDKGEADMEAGENSFTAKLKENGDYVIQLQNISGKPVEVTVTIEIK